MRKIHNRSVWFFILFLFVNTGFAQANEDHSNGSTNFIEVSRKFIEMANSNENQLTKEVRYFEAGNNIIKNRNIDGAKNYNLLAAYSYLKSSDLSMFLNLIRTEIKRNPFTPQVFELLNVSKKIAEGKSRNYKPDVLDYVFLRALSVNHFWMIIAIFNVFFWCGCLFLYLRSHYTQWSILRSGANVLVVFSALFIIGRATYTPPFDGLVNQYDIELKTGPGKSFESENKVEKSFGLDFLILGQEKSWYKIELSNGDAGWLHESNLLML